MNFEPNAAPETPYFDDIAGKDGWEGHTSKKKIPVLLNEIKANLANLGGAITLFQEGKFSIDGIERDGFRLEYVIKTRNGPADGRIDIAALPIKRGSYWTRTEKSRAEQSLKMALYMTNVAIRGMFALQKLSPNYAALIPFMLQDGRTLSELWVSGPSVSLLAPPSHDIVEGDIKE